MVLSNKEWLDKMDEIISAIQNGGIDSQVIEDMLSNMWISSVTYNVGDYVLYNNNIWKCLVQNSNVAPSEGSTWTRINITSEISILNSKLVNKKRITSTTNDGGGIHLQSVSGITIDNIVSVTLVGGNLEIYPILLDNGFLVVKTISGENYSNSSITFNIWYKN